MSKEIRFPLDDVEINIQKAFDLVVQLINEHPEIEYTLWAGAIWTILVSGYINCGFSREEFIEEIARVSGHYKEWWNEK